MNFTLKRVSDAKSFEFLSNANKSHNGSIVTVLGMVAAFHVFDALTTLIKQLLFCKFSFWFWGCRAIASGQGFMFR